MGFPGFSTLGRKYSELVALGLFYEHVYRLWTETRNRTVFVDALVIIIDFTVILVVFWSRFHVYKLRITRKIANPNLLDKNP